jgi:hypothetical protein
MNPSLIKEDVEDAEDADVDADVERSKIPWWKWRKQRGVIRNLIMKKKFLWKYKGEIFFRKDHLSVEILSFPYWKVGIIFFLTSKLFFLIFFYKTSLINKINNILNQNENIKFFSYNHKLMYKTANVTLQHKSLLQ